MTHNDAKHDAKLCPKSGRIPVNTAICADYVMRCAAPLKHNLSPRSGLAGAAVSFPSEGDVNGLLCDGIVMNGENRGFVTTGPKSQHILSTELAALAGARFLCDRHVTEGGGRRLVQRRPA